MFYRKTNRDYEFLVVLGVLLLSVFTGVLNPAISSASSGEKSPDDSVAAVDATEGNGIGGFIAASGSNRFVVWYDFTPGNFDILFKRSTDNGATWKPTVNLSNNAGHSYTPQVASDGANVYVAWLQRSADGQSSDIYFRRSIDNGATWQPKIKISQSGDVGHPLPQIAISDSDVFIIWDDQTTYDIFIRRSADGGATWKPIKNLSKNAGLSEYPQIAVSEGNVYVTWKDFAPGNADIFIRTSPDNGVTWKLVVNLSKNAGVSGPPNVAAFGSKVYVAWSDLTDEKDDILFRRSTDGGATWKPVRNLTNNPGYSSTPTVVAVGSNVYLSWLEQNAQGTSSDVYFRRSPDNGANWEPRKNLSQSGAVFDSVPPQIAVSAPNVYISWYDPSSSGDVLLRQSADNGATWKPTRNLSENEGKSQYPQIVPVGNNIDLVWMDDTTGKFPDLYDIFYRRSIDGGTTWKPTKNISNNFGDSHFL